MKMETEWKGNRKQNGNGMEMELKTESIWNRN
jgi:hypothetical protein